MFFTKALKGAGLIFFKHDLLKSGNKLNVCGLKGMMIVLMHGFLTNFIHIRALIFRCDAPL